VAIAKMINAANAYTRHTRRILEVLDD